uniref:G_PROTEIN_RECEP_F1_2 domain-containing protein n=1 Tax=Globodera pallida TaxID=36090 RepID=A0A183CU30_GLOPA
ASIVQNTLLFYVFSTSRKLRRQNYVNPVLLAFFDIFVSFVYLLISPVHFVAHRLRSPLLAAFWAWNVRLFYCLQHFALTVCNLLLVVASLERFLANGPLHSQVRRQKIK